MPLPKIATPTYELVLPSTKKTIKYRPFLVKEEKLLVLALETEDQKQITSAIKSVLKNCIQTRGVKVETLPTFDIEFLFLNIRGKSVGEEVDVNIIAPDDGVTEIPVKIDIDQIKVLESPEHNNQIKLNDELMMEMKYPSLEQFIKNNFDFNQSNFDQSFDLIASCVNKIYSEDEVWSADDVTKKEIIEFLETMPKLSHTVKVRNQKTGVESEVVLEGLSSFFA